VIVALAWLACIAPAPLTVTVLGSGGGLDESDLSAYLVSAPAGGYVLLDAGTVLHGLEVALGKGAFNNLPNSVIDAHASREVNAARLYREQTHAVLLSHAHLDHIEGLVVASPDDVPRTVYGLPSTVDALRDTAFNWKLWPNLGSEGAAPALKKITYARMDAGVERDVAGFHVTALPLSHGGVVSTAFLLEDARGAILYVGDTGPDAVEKSDKLAAVWARVAPLVRAHKLKALFLECSYPSARPDDKLYGHMSPRHVSAELIKLANAVDDKHPGDALRGLTVVITHIKPSLEGDHPRDTIAAELRAQDTLGIKLVLPQQGDALAFP
jgi:3',5'-cyclic-nucleotide phosphodiesterase